MAEVSERRFRGDWLSVVTFGLVGLVGGWITAGLWRFGDWVSTLLLTGVTALVAGALGWVAPRVWRRSPVALGFAVLGAGALNGAVILVVLVFAFLTSGTHDGGEWILLAPLFAALVGAVVAVPFVPGLIAIARCHRRRSDARDGSVVRQAYDRAVWRTAALVITSGCAFSLIDGRPPSYSMVGVAVVAGVTIAATALLDLCDLQRVGRTGAELVRCRPWPMGAEELAQARRAGIVTDLGLGEPLVARLHAVAHAYRDVERPAAIVWGDHERCRSVLRRLTGGSIAMTLAAMFLALLCGATR
ncbi:MAG: hypothetical protein JRI68_33330, partial [Deltaproteobacteria bacterium]|nr:hypothetical protein [Deltaproteobacteria bacterium]